MKFISKHIQQIIVVLVITAISVSGVYAAGVGSPFNFTDVMFGFVRKISLHPDPHPIGHHGKNFFYGYGWSGDLQQWGYGYGYLGAFVTSHLDSAEELLNQGFDGSDGSPVIESVTVNKTSATIGYSTSYLAKGSWGYGFTTPVTRDNSIRAEQEADFNSGERTVTFTDLQCGTLYYFAVAATDAGKNSWIVQDSFTTKACNDSPRVGGYSQNNPIANDSTSPAMKPLTVRIPAIFLSFGSFGVDVQDLQKLLNSFGTLLDTHNGAGGPGHETYYFGHKTETALKRFQSIFGLAKVDGIYGPETQRVMYEQLVK